MKFNELQIYFNNQVNKYWEKEIPNIWDYFIYSGLGIMVLWLVWNLFGGRRIKAKDSIYPSEIGQSLSIAYNKSLLSFASGKRVLKRLQLFKDCLRKEKEVVMEANELVKKRELHEYLKSGQLRKDLNNINKERTI